MGTQQSTKKGKLPPLNLRSTTSSPSPSLTSGSGSGSASVTSREQHPTPLSIPRTFTQIRMVDSQDPKLSICSWNVMADIWSPPHSFSYLPPWAVSWHYRGRLVVSDLQTILPDVIALQEVGSHEFLQHLFPTLHSGIDEITGNERFPRYDGFHVENPSTEGLAIFWKKTRFEFIQKHSVHFERMAQTSLSGFDSKTTEYIVYDVMRRHTHHNIAAFVLLKDIQTQQFIVVISTHLYAGSPARDMNFQIHPFQANFLLQELERFIHQNQVSPTVFFCGDFNSTPSDGLYSFLQTGRLANDHKDLTRRKSMSPLLKDFHHNFSLRSSYSLSPTGEPAVTYCNRGSGCLDYIFFGQLSSSSSASSSSSPSSSFSSPFQLTELMDMLPSKSYDKTAALPTLEYGSDHISLMATFTCSPPTT